VTRRDPPLPIARLRARGQVTEIRAADLRFTPAEAAAFLSKMTNVSVDEATAAPLDEKTEGWVTGLRLAGLYLRDRGDVRRLAQELHGSSGHIAEYLVAEVLSRHTPEFVACLVETSILDRFCAALCEALHAGGASARTKKGSCDPRQFINWLVKENLFVISLDSQGCWFRYHHLFQQMLQRQLRRRRSADDIATLHSRACEWFAQEGLTDEAIQHAVAAGDSVAATRLVNESRHDALISGRWHVLERRLARLPEAMRESRPEVLMAQAWVSYNRFEHRAISQLLGDAKASLGESRRSAMLKGELLFFEGHAHFWDVEDSRSRRCLEKAVTLIPEAADAFRGDVCCSGCGYASPSAAHAGDGNLTLIQVGTRIGGRSGRHGPGAGRSPGSQPRAAPV